MEELPSQMKVLMKERPEEGYTLVSRPVPKPGSDEVLIKVQKASICGSDINLWKWNETAKVIATIPFIPGHEATGIVVAVGSNVKSPKIGDRVAIENHYFCGDCFQCKEGRGDICQRMSQYGHGKGTDQGGCGQYSLIPARYCFIITRNISPTEAALLEPMGVAHNAVETLGVEGHDVLVLGCGPIGLLSIAISKILGASKIYGVDVVKSRLDLGKKMGADVLINGAEENISERVRELTNGNGFGRIIEASGALLNSSFTWLRKGGAMVLIGLPKNPLYVENVLPDVVFKSLTLKSIHGRRIFHTWEECEKLLSQKQIDIMPMVSHSFNLKDYKMAFQSLLSGEGCKIVLDPQQI